MAFAQSQGKVAVHCHAGTPISFIIDLINQLICISGLGRTGVLMACYLIYHLRVKANDGKSDFIFLRSGNKVNYQYSLITAIRYVRAKRPRSLQTRSQIQITQEFEHFLLPLSQIFCIR